MNFGNSGRCFLKCYLFVIIFKIFPFVGDYLSIPVVLPVLLKPLQQGFEFVEIYAHPPMKIGKFNFEIRSNRVIIM
jgi:hypothetical protein